MLWTLMLVAIAQESFREDFGVGRLEALLELRQAQVVDAQEWVRIERVVLEQVEREGALGPPRRLQIHRQTLAEVEATLLYREAVRDAAKLALDHARKRAASGSPEEDVDQVRARLDSAVQVARARLASFDAYVASNEALVESEKARLELLVKQALSGTVPAISLRHAELRQGLSKAGLRGAIARQTLAKDSLKEAEEARRRFDEGGAGTPAGPADLLRRLEQLEDDVLRLEDETQFLRRRMQREIEAELDELRTVSPVRFR